MRAVVVREFGEPATAAVEELPDPAPDPGHVVVATRMAGVNYADFATIAGHHPIHPDLPFTPGVELAGEVVGVGDKVSDVAEGDRVTAIVTHGAWAERSVVPASACYTLPEGMSFEHGAAIGLAYQAAHFALTERAHATSGERVMVTGASGGVGIATIQLARAMGCKAFAAIRNPANAEFVTEAGADRVIHIGDNPATSLPEQVREATGGHGADVIVDLVGGNTFSGCMHALAFGGRVVVVGFASGERPSVDVDRLLADNLSVVGLYWMGYRAREPAWVRRVQNDLFGLYGQGKIKPYVTQVYPFAEFADALGVVSRARVKGKVLLSLKR